MDFSQLPPLSRALAARDAWSLIPAPQGEPLEGDAAEFAAELRRILADDAADYPYTTAPRAESALDLVRRLRARHAEMSILLGLFAFDRDQLPALFDTLQPLAGSLTRVVEALLDKANVIEANPVAADDPGKIVKLEAAFDAIDAGLAQGFAVVARSIAAGRRSRKGRIPERRGAPAGHHSTER